MWLGVELLSASAHINRNQTMVWVHSSQFLSPVFDPKVEQYKHVKEAEAGGKTREWDNVANATCASIAWWWAMMFTQILVRWEGRKAFSAARFAFHEEMMSRLDKTTANATSTLP